MESNEQAREPWEIVSEILSRGDRTGLQGYLDALPPGEKARLLSRIEEDEQARLLQLLGSENAASLLDDLSDVQAIDILEDLPAEHAAAIIDEMPSDHQADLLGDLDQERAEAILQEMDPAEAQDARELLEYEENTAGGLMITEYLSYVDTLAVRDVLEDLRLHGESYSDYDVQYAYLTTADAVLVGVLRLRDLLLSSPERPIRGLMIADPLHVAAETPLEDLVHFFHEHHFLGVPVVDSEMRLVGVLRRLAVEEAAGDRANETFLRVSGHVGDEELRTMPLHRRSLRRLSWLSANILLNVVAASVIAMYQETLQAAIVLAVFLPIISDMSGCSGNQAVAVSIRELTLGLVKPYEFWRVLGKEASVGLLNGLALGLILGGISYLWKGNVYLGLVVGAAMMLNTLLAVSLGGLIPLALKALKADPALASGPILTTVTDMCGFFLVLSFASAVLPHLT